MKAWIVATPVFAAGFGTYYWPHFRCHGDVLVQIIALRAPLNGPLRVTLTLALRSALQVPLQVPPRGYRGH